MKKNKYIYFAGPLPPPTHGLSVISARMLDALRLTNAHVHVFDLTPRRPLSPLLQWFRFLWKILIHRSRDSTLYLPLSGGPRQIVDLVFALSAKLAGFKVFIHHHSFAYLNSKPWIARFVFVFLKASIHIALCDKMSELLTAQYGIASANIRVLSNAVFIDTDVSAPKNLKEGKTELTIGFLSNITAEKGIFLFFEALKALRFSNISFRAVIAGPVSSDIRADFDSELCAAPNAVHVGAVYGSAKDSFFQEVDVLLFPTQYINEAEPVTLWEAMAHGVPVIALQRGCIQSMIPIGVGHVVFNADEFISSVVEAISTFIGSPDSLDMQRVLARDSFCSARKQSGLVLESLLVEMINAVKN